MMQPLASEHYSSALSGREPESLHDVKERAFQNLLLGKEHCQKGSKGEHVCPGPLPSRKSCESGISKGARVPKLAG